MAEAAPQLVNFDKIYTKLTANKGKGLFAKCSFQEGDQILIEKPLISCQFSWNKLYNYTACDNCLKSLETAENMARRLTGNMNLELLHKECCEVEKAKLLYCQCPACNVSHPLGTVNDMNDCNNKGGGGKQNNIKICELKFLKGKKYHYPCYPLVIGGQW